jgi:MFS family permease
VIFACGFLALSQIDSLGGFYVCAVLLAVGASLGGYFPLTVALVQWFERHRARAMSIMSLGMAWAALAVPLVAWSMHAFGWRATALGSGVVALLIGLPLARMIRSRPEDHGETVDGLPAEAPSAPPAATGAPRRHQRCRGSRVHRAPGPAHPRLLAARRWAMPSRCWW